MICEPAFDDFARLYRAGQVQVVVQRLVDDLETPVSAYLKVAHGQPYSFLFESVEGGAWRGRYSCLVMAPDLVSIRDTNRLRQMAMGFGITHTTIVLNRLGMPGGLTLPLLENGLGCKPMIQIPDLGKQLGRAANLGKPALMECAIFGKAMALLAQEMSGAPASRTSRSGIGSLIGWISGR